MALNRAAAAVSPEAARLPPLLFFTDPQRTPRPWETAKRLPPGAGVVFRAFGRPDAIETGLRLREATQAASARLLVGLDPDLAEAVGADGLHLPERALDQADALRAARPDWIVTGALHGPPAPGADLSALDAVVVSPVFAAGGASAARRPLGLDGFAAIARAAGRPAYALGGIGVEEAETLSPFGACGIAAVDGVRSAWG